MSMTIQEAIKRITDHMEVHHIGEPPHIHIGEALQMAIAALREKAERENPQPLTLDELRKMNGEPVYTIGVYQNGDIWAGWDIIEKADDDKLYFGYSCEQPEWWAYNLRDANGKLFGCAWIAYRHKPKEVIDECSK